MGIVVYPLLVMEPAGSYPGCGCGQLPLEIGILYAPSPLHASMAARIQGCRSASSELMRSSSGTLRHRVMKSMPASDISVHGWLLKSRTSDRAMSSMMSMRIMGGSGPLGQNGSVWLYSLPGCSSTGMGRGKGSMVRQGWGIASLGIPYQPKHPSRA